MNRVFVLMSSNCDADHNLKACLALLRDSCRVLAVSSVYETPPVGEDYRDPFLDAVVELEIDLEPLAFREALRKIETQLGRQRSHPPPIKIPIDLDLLLWNQDSFDYGEKPRHIPDQSIRQQIHLALPLAELAPDYCHPETGQTLQEIANTLPGDNITLRSDIILE